MLRAIPSSWTCNFVLAIFRNGIQSEIILLKDCHSLLSLEFYNFYISQTVYRNQNTCLSGRRVALVLYLLSKCSSRSCWIKISFGCSENLGSTGSFMFLNTRSDLGLFTYGYNAQIRIQRNLLINRDCGREKPEHSMLIHIDCSSYFNRWVLFSIY